MLLGRVENGATKGHWAGQRGHTALTRRIREELRDSLKRWFQDKHSSHHRKTEKKNPVASEWRPSLDFCFIFQVL